MRQLLRKRRIRAGLISSRFSLRSTEQLLQPRVKKSYPAWAIRFTWPRTVPYLCLVNPRYLQLIAGKPQRRACLRALSNGLPVGDSWDIAGTVDHPSTMGQAKVGHE